MNIAVIGIGGVGGYYGGKLSALTEKDPDLKLYFIARGPHLEAVRKNGLLLETSDGTILCRPTLATDDFDELPVLDLCIITVKSYELENVLTRLEPKVAAGTVVIPLLNGADIHERVRKIIKTGIVLPSCVYIISYIESPGKVVHKNPSCIIHTGNEPLSDEAVRNRTTDILKKFDEAGISYKRHDDPFPEIWRKFLFIASFALVTARYNAVIGKVMESEEMSGSVKGIINEIFRIAEAKGIALPADACEKAFSLGAKFDYDSTTSFQRDYIQKDKPDERDIFGSAIIRMGREYGVDTGETERIFSGIEINKPQKL